MLTFALDAIPGWATIAASVLLLGRLQLGIMGEYVGRIFEEVKQRPLYWVRDELKRNAQVRPKQKIR